MSLSLTKVQEHPSFDAFTLRSLVILRWKDAPSLASVAASVATIDSVLAASDRKVVLCAVTAPRVSMPDGPAREALQKAIKRIEPRLQAAVNVVLASGFAGAAVRSVLTGFSLVVRAPYPVLFVGSMAEAASAIVGVWPASDAPTPEVAQITAALVSLTPA